MLIFCCTLVIISGVFVIINVIRYNRAEKKILKLGFTYDELEEIDIFCEKLDIDFVHFANNKLLQTAYRGYKIAKEIINEK